MQKHENPEELTFVYRPVVVVVVVVVVIVVVVVSSVR